MRGGALLHFPDMKPDASSHGSRECHHPPHVGRRRRLHRRRALSSPTPTLTRMADRAPITRSHSTADFHAYGHQRHQPAPLAGPTMYGTPTGGPVHVWLSLGDEPVPGLLMEWRKPAQTPREGRVIYPELRAGQWCTIERWLVDGGSITLATART